MNEERVEEPGAIPSKPPGVLQELFSVDVRSLAVLRIGIALLVMVDLARRIEWTRLFHSDYGVLTASQASEFLGPGYWSLYWLNGSPWFASTLFVVTGLAAAGLLVGYQTRWMTAACLVLVWSLQICNPMILTAGHILMRMMLFWMLFLPVATVWSVDASRRKRQVGPRQILSMGSAAILLQIAYMYFFSGLAKWNPYWTGGSALQYAMNFEMYVKPAGQWLAQYPDWLQFLTLLTLAAEILGPVLMFIPRCSGWFRGFFMGFFWLLHLSIWLTMSIGLFSMVAMLAWVVFIPTEIWNVLLGERAGTRSAPQVMAVRRGKWFSGGIATVFLVYITLQNILFLFPQKSNLTEASTSQTQEAADAVEIFGRITMTIQQFRMFDTPPLYDPWYEYGATLMDGRQVELFTGLFTPLGQRPESVYDAMQNQYWRRFHWGLTTHPSNPPDKIQVYEQIRQRLLLEIVERWNDRNPNNPVVTAWLKCYLEPIELDRVDSEEPPAATQPILWASYPRPSGDSP